MFFKVIYKKEVHVYHSKGDASYESLRKYIDGVFKQLPAKYQLTYFDDEDEITLACQSDLETMMQISSKTAKVYISEVDESFYDHTQKVVLDDEMRVQPLEQQIQEMRLDSQDQAESVQSSEPLLEDSSKKAQVEMQDEIKSVSQSDEHLEEKNDQPEIIEDEKSEEHHENLIPENSMLNQSQITKITEADIEEKFKELMPQFMEKVKRSLLQKSFVNEKNSRIVHKHVTCDECGKSNIQGIRYKCSVCADFDVCETCEATSNHKHPFLKIKHPKQAPIKIFTVIDDENEDSFEVNGNRSQLPHFPFVNQIFEAFGKSLQMNGGGFNFGCGNNRPQCPFKRNFEKKEEEKMEEKVVIQQPQKKTKVEEKKPAEQSFERKPSCRIFQKPKTLPKQFEQAQKKANQKIIENAKYLFEILSAQVTENQCEVFARKHQGLSKEELLNVFFSQRY